MEKSTDEQVSKPIPKGFRYLKRKLTVREDQVQRLDKLGVIMKTSTSSIVEEALDMYFDFLKRNMNQEKVEEVLKEDKSVAGIKNNVAE